MQQQVFRWIMAGCLLAYLAACNKKDFELLEIKQFPSYPSGSAIALLNGRLYLAGDDVPYVLVLDKTLRVVDSIRISSENLRRISKDVKPDYEALATIKYENTPALLLLGSGSNDPYRNQALVLRPGDSNVTFRLDHFYAKLKRLNIRDLNVEGATTIPGGVLLSSRGNKGFPKNYLVYVAPSFFLPTDSSAIKLIKVGANTDTASFKAVSGLEYAAKSDKLLLTVSTENTQNSYDDGTIGKSYLWIINDITTRKRFSHINPDRILDLAKSDSRFKGHKIESVCIINETRKHLELVLVADSDRGDTWLFRAMLRK